MPKRPSFGANETDIRLIADRCTYAEFTAYQQLRYRAITLPDLAFHLAGYLVADASAVDTPKHGRRKAHLASLVRKGIIVALDRSHSRTQRYLIGCIHDDVCYYISWLDEVFDWNTGLAFSPHDASHQASTRAIRPARSETPQTLMDKGFAPFHPNRSSSYRLPAGNEDLSIVREASRVRNRKPAAPTRGPAKRKALSKRDQQITQLANDFSRLAGTLPNLSPRFRKIWAELLSYCGYAETRQLMFATWKARTRLLNSSFPVLTVHNIKYYATMFWVRDAAHPSRQRRLRWIGVVPMSLTHGRLSSLHMR
jgi:hypothetical protein